MSLLYLFDTSIYIGAYQRYYSALICPGFWNCLLHLHQARKVLSIDHVYREIMDRKNEDSSMIEPDFLARWANGKARSMFMSCESPDIEAAHAEVMEQAVKGKYTKKAIDDFGGKADSWLIAFALVHNAVLVTGETLKKDAKARVIIPNICEELGVRWQDTFTTLEELDVNFRWSPNEAREVIEI